MSAPILQHNPAGADPNAARRTLKYDHERPSRTPMSAPGTLRTAPSYPFRLRDPVSGRLVRARFIAKLKDIADCCAAWEIVAPARPGSKPPA
jgi:hypothetical protein